ncbi:hypothetical protein [Brevundimonas sp.]|uniref:hypothetical protein n=1 Tax=Brevundimonas sp. TaxID=1871086 RepID=UPI002D4815DA|nr:hypothetical protein [Brevundimonas sp.]HYD26950.1 hypothetical protein [Brevundimonas sp.]
MILIKNPLTPLAWKLIAGALVVLVVWLLWNSGQRARQREAAARADSAFASARTGAATDANRIQDEALSGRASDEALSRKHADELLQAPGAGQRLDPGLNRAARERLCQRAAYRDRPDCVQLAGGRQPPR